MNKLSKIGNALLARSLIVMAGTSTLINVSAEVGLEASQVSTEILKRATKHSH